MAYECWPPDVTIWGWFCCLSASPSFGGVLVYIFREQILALLIGADSTAAHSRFVTGIELLAALYSLMNGAIPIPQLVNGRTVYDDPSDIAAGGLIRHTLAGSIGILKQCISHLFREGGVLFEMSRDARPDLGLFYPVWSLHIGWPADIKATISVVVSGWFSSKAARPACDLARPIWVMDLTLVYELGRIVTRPPFLATMFLTVASSLGSVSVWIRIRYALCIYIYIYMRTE